jgi:hypothetical protein
MENEQINKILKLKSRLDFELFSAIIESDISVIAKDLNLSLSDIINVLNSNIGFDEFVKNHIQIFKLELLFRFYNICHFEYESKSVELISQFDDYLSQIGLDIDFPQFKALYDAHLIRNAGNNNIDWSTGCIRTSSGHWEDEFSETSQIETLLNKKSLHELIIPKDYDINNLIQTIDINLNTIDWDSLTLNLFVKWDRKLIQRYENWLNWELLSGREDLDWSDKLLSEFKDRFVWGKFSKFNGTSYFKAGKVHFDNGEFNTGTKYFKFESLNCISYNKGINWNLDLIKQFEDYIDFFLLARNGKINFEIIKCYEEKWYRKEVVYSERVRINSDTWDDYDYYSTGWENLMHNPNLKLTREYYNFLSSVNILIEKVPGSMLRIKANTISLDMTLEDSFIAIVINEPLLYHNVFYNWERCNQSIVDYIYSHTIGTKGMHLYGLINPDKIIRPKNFGGFVLWIDYWTKFLIHQD